MATFHRRVFGTLGIGAMLIGASRASRHTVLPLWADHIGVAPATVSLIFGVAAAAAVAVVGVALAYPSGVLMDRCGRRVTAVVAVMLGTAHGMSNGLVMTLGAAVSPPHARAEFLAAWRLTHHTGSLAGPLVVGAVATVSESEEPVLTASSASGPFSQAFDNADFSAIWGRVPPTETPSPS